MEHNCAFIDYKKAFRYRAAAIIVEDGCMLFARYEVDHLAVIHENFFRDSSGLKEVVINIVP